MRPEHRPRHLAFAAMLLAACSDYSTSLGKDGASGTSDEAGDTATVERSVRIDVHPSGDLNVHAQSFYADTSDDLSDLRLELARTVTLSGSVVGFRANPAADVVVPGEDDVPVQADVVGVVLGTVSGGTAETGVTGTYSLSLPALDGYLLSIIPHSPELLPFLVLDQQSMLSGHSLDVHLDFGIGVYGHVTQSDGSDVASVGSGRPRVSLIDSATGVEGAAVETTASGWYQLRAFPGEYTLRVEGADASTIPRVDVPEVVVVDGEGDALRVDVLVGTLRPTEVRGKVVDINGTAVVDAKVRFTSVSLTDALGDAFVETDTDRSGVVSPQLLPGEWRVEVIPPYDKDAVVSPSSFELRVEGTSQNLGEIVLPDKLTVEGTLLDPSGDPIQDAVVTATEAGFDQAAWSTITDRDGQFQLDVPDAPLVYTFSPPAGSSAAITRLSVSEPADGGGARQLSPGEIIEGVARSEGEALSFSLVELRTASGQTLASTLTDGDGGFRFRIDQGD